MKLTCLIASIVLIVCIHQHSINGAPIDDLTTVHPCLDGFELVDGQCYPIAFTTESSETESVSFKLQNITLPNTVVTEESKKLNELAASEDSFATTFEPKQFDKTPVEHDNEPLVHTDKPEEHNNGLFDYTSEPTKHETETFDYTTESLQYDNEPLTHTDKPEEHENEIFDYTTESLQHDIEPLVHTDKPEEHDNEPLDHTSEPVEHKKKPSHRISASEDHENEIFDYTTESLQHDIEPLVHTDKPEEHENEIFDYTTESLQYDNKPLVHTDKPEEHDNESLDHTSEPQEHDNEPSRPSGKSEESESESSGHTVEKSDETDLPKGCPAGTKPDEQGACEDEVDRKSTTVALDLKTLLSKDGKCPDGMALYGKKCVYIKSKQSLETKPMDDSNDFETNAIDKDNDQSKLVPLLPGNLCPGDSEYYSNGLCRLRTGSSTIKPLPPNDTECLAGEILINDKCTKKEIKSKFPMKSTTEFSKTKEIDSETEPVGESKFPMKSTTDFSKTKEIDFETEPVNENESTERRYKKYSPKSKVIKS